MNRYSLSHLADQTLLYDTTALAVRDRNTTADLLAHIAEVEARQLYLPAAYPSMFAYCMGVLRLSEDAASKRLHAARAARKFPVIFEALADGRVHLSAVVLLAPHLSEATVDELLAAATHKSKSEIEKLLVQRSARAEVPAEVESNSSSLLTVSNLQHAPGHVNEEAQLVANSAAEIFQHAPGHVDSDPRLAPGPVPRAKLIPLAAGRYSLQVTIEERTHDKLRYAQDLLGHQVPSGDVAQVLDRALDVLIGQLEKRKFAATTTPRPGRCATPAGGRHIPAYIKRAVWERDGAQCSFVSETGRRCPSRRGIQFDHMDEVARGGQASVGRIRLLCRAHNQYAAECTFGTEFMRGKRQ
ncbi:MAG: hypothetical protein ABIS67_03040, partial [Candidatus Eisenbacteria bacterium]